MPIPPIPFDIQLDIIQSVYIVSQSHDIDYRTLSSCALVCRDWLTPAQRLLFRRIPPARHSLDALIILHAFATNPHLCTYVRSFPTNISDTWYMHRRYILRPSFPHLAELHYLYGRPSMPALHALGLRPSVLVYDSTPDAEWLPAVIEALPSVRHLVLNEACGLLNFMLPPNAHLLSIKYGTTIDFAKFSILPGPAARAAADISFHELHLGYLHFPAKMAGVALCIARNLRSLTLWMLVPSNATLEQLTALESLVIGGLPKTPLALPRTLRHFGLHQRLYDLGMRADRTQASLPDTGVSPSAVPLAVSLLNIELSELCVVWVTRCSKAYVRQALNTASEARGAEFLEYADTESFPNVVLYGSCQRALTTLDWPDMNTQTRDQL
ncbi:hypothetical protein FA95DRAFT_1577656 [Auriscalpium vulgare]|uniref:Uncharacterized protein n=1 Tax=Auriscalpium vulgare TaxID=40419 RepID=A0ACB8R5W8_9AGAM|nr:hypothetical protein FA95DRAFT_1577656 [Auriscalpium vulgare]